MTRSILAAAVALAAASPVLADDIVTRTVAFDNEGSTLAGTLYLVATLDEVDPGRINGLGICASAGYMVDAVSGNPKIASVGLVAPWLQNAEIVEAVYGGADGVAGLIEVSRAAEAAGGEIIPAAGPEGAEGVLMPIGGYHHEPDRGAIPEYGDKWDQASWEGWLTYAPADDPGRLDKPLAIVHSEAAAIPQGVRTFYTGEAVQRWLEDVTQFDFYDDPEDVTRAADTVAAHFGAPAPSDDVAAGDPIRDGDVAATVAELTRIADAIDAAVDAKDWATARTMFTDTIDVDFTSLVGGEPVTIPIDALIEGWSTNLKPSKTSYHQRGNEWVRDTVPDA